MTDPTAMLSGDLGNILNFLGAASGLGTAAMGVVDALKAFRGGPSNIGFRIIERTLRPFLVAGSGATIAFKPEDIAATLRANWLNGVAKAEQKAKAKSLIHLGLTLGNAEALAAAAGVDAGKLLGLAQHTATGAAVPADEIAVLGQFDAVLSAVLDEAYERGDQQYRNATKLLSALVATLLAVIGGWVIYANATPPPAGFYFASSQFVLALLVGVSATPLAPVAKDLASSLQAAVAAVAAVRR